MLENLRSRFYGAASASALSALTLLSASAGCSTSTQTVMTDTWRDPNYAAGPMRSIVVFGGKMDETNRRSLEDRLVAALSAQGVRATASYALFPGELPSKDEARAVIQQAGADGVLVSSMRGTTQRQTYVSGAYEGGFWDGFYGPGWGGAWAPGYVVTDQFVKFETSLWDPKGNGKMVWSAVTQTENPSSGMAFASSLTKAVLPALTKAGFLPPSPEGKPMVSQDTL